MTVDTSALTAEQLDAKLSSIAGMQGSAAQAGAALLLTLAVGDLTDPAERARLKDRIMQAIQELGTCGDGMRSSADVRACGTLMDELTSDPSSTSEALRDSAMLTSLRIIELGLLLGLPLADMGVDELTSVFSGLLLANTGDAQFVGLAVQAVTEAAALICGAAAQESAGTGALYEAQAAALGIRCAAQDAVGVTENVVTAGTGVQLLLGTGASSFGARGRSCAAPPIPPPKSHRSLTPTIMLPLSNPFPSGLLPLNNGAGHLQSSQTHMQDREACGRLCAQEGAARREDKEN